MSDYSKIVKTEENLIQYVYSYNWDDGFDIPNHILNEKECTLQVALLIFELADGFSYLETKGEGVNLPEWVNFIGGLYNRIMSSEYQVGKCEFKPNLSKVQLYKLEKSLAEAEHIFITPINTDSEDL